MTGLVEIAGLDVVYRRPWPARGSDRRALHGIDLAIGAGEIFGLVGESGSGKSTLARVLLGLTRPTAGTIRIGGVDPFALSGAALKAHRRSVQAVFQDSVAALDPRRRVGDSIREGLDIHRVGTAAERRERVDALLHDVGLEPEHGERYPRALSGGQRQRVAIARALALSPRLIIADEPVSALDVSVQAQILDLLLDLRAKTGVTLLFISHDLGVVRRIADRVGVLHDGRLVEAGDVEGIYRTPAAAYTRLLIDSVPRVDFALLASRHRHATDAANVPASQD